MYIGIVLCVLIVFSLHQESLKLILVNKPLPEGVLTQFLYDEVLATLESHSDLMLGEESLISLQAMSEKPQ
jgi:hypothetical protein